MDSRVDEMFGAFADFTRLRLLHLLIHRKELCVADMMSAIEAPQSKVSRHLSRLRASGLVVDRKRGRWRCYSLAQPKTRFHARILDCLRSCHQEVRILKQDFARLKRSPSVMGR